jgi:hypothetical protein
MQSTVRYLVVVIYVGGEAAATTLVNTATTDLNQIGNLATNVNTATGGAITVSQESVSGDMSGGGSSPLNPQQDAKVSLLRSGAAYLQTGTTLYLTAIYSGTIGTAQEGMTITGVWSMHVGARAVSSSAGVVLVDSQYVCVCVVWCAERGCQPTVAWVPAVSSFCCMPWLEAGLTCCAMNNASPCQVATEQYTHMLLLQPPPSPPTLQVPPSTQLTQ